jgi:hypothetical protein
VNIADVKKELSSDEKVLESAFKLETLYKKHKFKIWAVVAALVLFFGGKALQESMHASALAKANDAFITLQSNAGDSQALKVLKESNPALFELFSYAQAVKNKDVKALEALTNSKNSVVADASSYTVGVLNKKPVDSELYKDLALFEQAYLAIGAGDKKSAKAKLELIDERSALAVVTGFLKHSLIKAK